MSERRAQKSKKKKERFALKKKYVPSKKRALRFKKKERFALKKRSRC